MANEIIRKKDPKDTKTDDKPFFVPRVDVQYSDKETVVNIDMPGVDDKNVDISLEENNLTVSGYCNLQIPEGYALKWQEYRIGNYRKSFKLNDRIDSSKISAEMKDGVLKMVLPVKEKCKPVKIKVKGN